MQQKNAQLAADLAAMQARNHNDNVPVIFGMSDMSELKVQQMVANVMSRNNNKNAQLRAELDELKSRMSSTSFTHAQRGGESTGGGGRKIDVDGGKIEYW